ncbi:MAG: DUF1788 domain-containing protein [Chloroflexi bacterium]|nr:MAG: DUF1788 domain-containing protein [Chloroflexota bacterium]
MNLSAKFEELETLLLNDQHRSQLRLHSGVPFIILVYDPRDEHKSRALQIQLREKLNARQLKVTEYKLNAFIFDYYAGKNQLDRIFELDRDPARRDELQRMIAGVYEKQLVEKIKSEAAELNNNPDRNIIFLTSVVSIYPFARVSNLLTDLENHVLVPLVVFYPGGEVDGKLSFLNREAHVGYRARIL